MLKLCVGVGWQKSEELETLGLLYHPMTRMGLGKGHLPMMRLIHFTWKCICKACLWSAELWQTYALWYVICAIALMEAPRCLWGAFPTQAFLCPSQSLLEVPHPQLIRGISCFFRYLTSTYQNLWHFIDSSTSLFIADKSTDRRYRGQTSGETVTHSHRRELEKNDSGLHQQSFPEWWLERPVGWSW
jgi:hypothetical protein